MSATLLSRVFFISMFLALISFPAVASDGENCLSCHGRKGAPYYVSEEQLNDSVHRELGCTDCHVSITGYPHKRISPVDCLGCHSGGEAEAAGAAPRDYSQSVHAMAAGGPVCKTCHGTHHILSSEDPRSSTYRSNVPRLCGSCHPGPYGIYKTSIHGQMVLERGDLKAAVCYDCHMEHAVPPIGEPRWKLWLIQECGSCHKRQLDTYRETYHGQVTNLGYTTVARCPDCHGSHGILPPQNPGSTVSEQNIVTTCRKCHAYANRNFAEYYPHPNDRNRQKYPVLFYTFWAMSTLLIGVFSFFIVHTSLWAYRGIKERRQKKQ
ncbi:MAG: cytochrome c3 family protein [Nitrospirota bacterium]|jgi:nitrate/TMAO reductase-like tetraheme cytochrome c subunit